MRRFRIILFILIVCVIVIHIVFRLTIYFPWVILPVESSQNTLTLVKYGGPHLKRIILKHYLNSNCVHTYVLKLNAGLGEQLPQKYKLPLMDEGMVEICVEFDDAILPNVKNQLKVTYDDAASFYKKGILIYSEGSLTKTHTIDKYVYYDQYIHFISGEEQKTYVEVAKESKWKFLNNASKPKKRTPKFPESYIPVDNEWKEKNRWRQTNSLKSPRTQGDANRYTTQGDGSSCIPHGKRYISINVSTASKPLLQNI